MSITASYPDQSAAGIGGYPRETIDQFLANAQAARAIALGPAMNLPSSNIGDSAHNARAYAIQLNNRFNEVEKLLTAVQDERDRLTTAAARLRPDIVRQQWADYAAATSDQADNLGDEIRERVAQLPVLLRSEAIPEPTDSTAVMLARDEIRLAAQVNDDPTQFQTFLELADRGGDIAAVLASAWGRLLMASVGVDDDGAYQAVVDRAIQATNSGPAQQAALAALNALSARRAVNSPAGGALAEAVSYYAFLLGAIERDMTIGIVVP